LNRRERSREHRKGQGGRGEAMKKQGGSEMKHPANEVKGNTIVPERLKVYAAAAIQKGLDDALVVTTAKVHTAPWVRMKCQFGCPAYGERLCCPPHTPTPEQTRKLLDSYHWAILLHRHWKSDYGTVEKLNDVVVDLERTIFLDGFYKALALVCGPCTLCRKCDVGGKCLHTEKARPSMESCGIDVFATAREHGLPIRVVRDHSEERDVYGLVLVE
jgi:predicted metal-binding protein